MVRPGIVGTVIAAGIAVGAVDGPVRAEQVQVPSTQAVIEQFRGTAIFWHQLDVSKELVRLGDVRVLDPLGAWLNHEDRHIRGNAAFVFAGLGDPRGLQTIVAMLTDRSNRPEGQGMPGGRWSLDGQIGADRYYAVHLLGELKDVRAVDVLLPLLTDRQVNYKVAWALGEIGDRRAIPPLIAALGNRDALVRVGAIQALEKLRTTEALPQLRALLDDQAMPSAGPRLSVAETAKAAIAKLQQEPTETATAEFERLYEAWHRESAAIAFSSNTYRYIGLPSYRKIVAIGTPALPALERKMAEDQGLDFMLAFAVVEICGWDRREFRGGSEQEFRDKVLRKLRGTPPASPAPARCGYQPEDRARPSLIRT